MNRKSATTLTPSLRRFRAAWFGAGVVAFTAVLMGCGDDGPPLVNAKGKVTYQGEPLPKAQVVFVGEGSERTAIATTDDQGQFTMMTDGRTGAMPGKYKVAVTAIKLLKEIPPDKAASMTNEEIYANQKSLIPEKYNNVMSSGLSAEVGEDPAQNSYTFELK